MLGGGFFGINGLHFVCHSFQCFAFQELGFLLLARNGELQPVLILGEFTKKTLRFFSNPDGMGDAQPAMPGYLSEILRSRGIFARE